MLALKIIYCALQFLENDYLSEELIGISLLRETQVCQSC